MAAYPGAAPAPLVFTGARLFSLLLGVLLVCGACSNVRQAPVEERDRQAPHAAVEQPVEPAEPVAPAAAPAGRPVPEEDYAQWEELSVPGAAADSAPAELERVSDNPAVVALLDDTDLRVSRGEREAAAGSLERALRLEPKNPWLWHRLAVLKLEQGQRRLAVVLAQKSNSLSAGLPALRRANAELIKRAGKPAE